MIEEIKYYDLPDDFFEKVKENGINESIKGTIK